MGSFGELLGVSWELFEASKSTKSAFELRFGTLLGLLCSFLAADDGQGSVHFVFYLLFEPLGVLLGLLGVVFLRAAGLMQTQKLISNGYGLQCWLTQCTERPMDSIMIIVILMMMMIICFWNDHCNNLHYHVCNPNLPRTAFPSSYLHHMSDQQQNAYLH